MKRFFFGVGLALAPLAAHADGETVTDLVSKGWEIKAAIPDAQGLTAGNFILILQGGTNGAYMCEVTGYEDPNGVQVTGATTSQTSNDPVDPAGCYEIH